MYNVTLTSTNLLMEIPMLIASDVVNATHFVLEVTLNFYTRYELVVVPFTGAGSGNSTAESFQTEEGGKYVVYCKLRQCE